MQEVDGIKVPFVPIGGVDGLKSGPQIIPPAGKSFEEVLKSELDRPSAGPLSSDAVGKSLKFSHHAQTRLESRDIQLSDADVRSLSDAVDRASEKGSQDSLLLMKNVAFIVNVRNRTVVTAVVADSAGGNGENLNDNVFTNIDSAVLVRTQDYASQQQ